MWLIVLEAFAALAVLLFLVWWTMFSGRRHGEMNGEAKDEICPPPDQAAASGGADEAADRGGSKKLKG